MLAVQCHSFHRKCKYDHVKVKKGAEEEISKAKIEREREVLRGNVSLGEYMSRVDSRYRFIH